MIQNLSFLNGLIVFPCTFLLYKFLKSQDLQKDLISWLTIFYKNYRISFLLRQFHVSNIISSLRICSAEKLLRKPPSKQSGSFVRNYKFFNDDEFNIDLKDNLWQNALPQNNILANMAVDVFSIRLVFIDQQAPRHKLYRKKTFLTQNHRFINEFNF